jgi:hypothetical protein
MADLGHSALNPTELVVSGSPSDSSFATSQHSSFATSQHNSHSPRIESLKQALADNVERPFADRSLSSSHPFLQEISRAFDYLRRYYVDSFVPVRTPRKSSMSPRASNAFSAEALVLLCEHFDMCPHPFPPSFICKIYSSLSNVSDSPADLIARSLIALACSGFRYSGIPGKSLSETEAFAALLQHMHYSQGPARLHTALGLGTAPRAIFRVAAPTYDGKNEASYFVECLPMLAPQSIGSDSHKDSPFRGAVDNSSSSTSGFSARGLAKHNQIAVASRISRFINLYREENNIENTGAPVLTQKSSDFERGIHDLFEFSRNKELKVIEMRQRQQQAELMRFNYTPQICPKSDHIAGEQHRAGTVEDRLLAEGRLSEAKVAAARMMQTRAVLAHAKLRPSSAPVRSRVASVPHKLAASDDQALSANQPLASARTRGSISAYDSHDFKPFILPASKRLHRSVRVEYALTAWGEARNAKWSAIRAQEEFKELQLSKRPSSSGIRRPITAVASHSLAATENSREKLSSWRLHSPESNAVVQNPKTRTEKVVQSLKLEAPSFQPRVDKISRKIDAQRHQNSQISSRFHPTNFNNVITLTMAPHFFVPHLDLKSCTASAFNKVLERKLLPRSRWSIDALFQSITLIF